jgi:hypothetical protein
MVELKGFLEFIKIYLLKYFITTTATILFTIATIVCLNNILPNLLLLKMLSMKANLIIEAIGLFCLWFIIFYFIRFVKINMTYWFNRRSILLNLTPEEKWFLNKFIVENKNTIYAAPQNATLFGLRAKGVVYDPTSVYNIMEGVPFNLQPWARIKLKKNKKLLDGAIEPAFKW